MAKYITIVCDRCHQTFQRDTLWTPEFKMDTGEDICPGCRIMLGMKIEHNKNGEIQ